MSTLSAIVKAKNNATAEYLASLTPLESYIKNGLVFTRLANGKLEVEPLSSTLKELVNKINGEKRE